MAIKKINVSSLDFDGCLGNDGFHQLLKAKIESEVEVKNVANMSDEAKRAIKREIEEKVCTDNKVLREAVITKNINLANALQQKIVDEEYTDAVLIIGSNRQDLATERDNSLTKGRCFPAIEAFQRHLNTLSKKIKFTLDKFLLGDRTKKQAGKTFKAGSRRAGITSQQANAAECYYGDESKVTLLYAQMHRMASLHPGAEITFDFYDDKLNILQGLVNYFQDHPSLLPPRMKLRLFNYTGGEIAQIGAINASDPEKQRYIDRNYMQTIDKMIACAGHDPSAAKSKVENDPPACIKEKSDPGTFGVLNKLKAINATEQFKIERNLLNLNKYLDKEIKRLDHWYLINGKYKASLLRQAKEDVNENAKNLASYADYKLRLFANQSLFAAINYNRHAVSEKLGVKPESALNSLRKLRI